MGTRNLTVVILDKEVRVAQYGQWDGYPSCSGVILAGILKKYTTENIRNAVSKCSFFTEEELKEMDKKIDNEDDFQKLIKQYPQLSRDHGVNVIELIVDNYNHHRALLSHDLLLSYKLKNRLNFALDSVFCEWAYVVDLDKEVVEVYTGFNKKKLTKKDRFFYMQNNKEIINDELGDSKMDHYPIKLARKFKFSEFTEDAMENFEND